MQQRARLFNGSLTVRGSGGRGTLVEAIIPAAADAVAAR
jgi:signal transduction histidine kinase